MKKNLMKALGLLLAGITILNVAGCKKAEETTSGGSDTKIRVFFQDKQTPDVALVAEEVSKITREKLGFDVEFVMYGPGEYAQKLPMMLASNEKMDIGFDSMAYGYEDRARKGAYWDLTEILPEKAPDLYDIYSDKNFLKGAQINGKLYALPTLKETGEQWTAFVLTEILEENNLHFDSDKIYSLKDLEPVLEVLKNKYPERHGFTISKSGEHNPMFYLNEFDTIDKTYMISKEDGKTISNLFMTDEFEEYSRLMRDWYNKGYIANDVATNDAPMVDKDINRMGVVYVSYSPGYEIAYKDAYDGKDVTVIKITPVVMSNASCCGSMFGIFEKSEHKEEALKFLELWNTDPQIKNLITYGIEGRHYTLENGKVKKAADASNMYLNQNWASGNCFISALQVQESDDKWELYEKFNKEAIASSAIGFHPDLTSINDKMLAVQGAAKQYGGLLSCGAVDPDEFIPKMRAAMTEAGVEAVVAEIQKQYDEWIAQQ